MATSLSAHRKRLREARAALRQATARLPQHDERYGVLIGLGDETLASDAIDQRVILAGVSFLEQALEKAICRHFRGDLSETERNKIFIGSNDGFGVLSNFSAKIDIARALGVLSGYAADDMHTLQAIRNHFAHARLTFSFDSDEVVALIKLLHRPDTIAGMAAPFDLLGYRSLIVYRISTYYFALDIYSPGSLVRHDP